jgi:hypothetical protein
MSLNKDILNPLSVLGVRRLAFIPDHFTKISIKSSIDTKMLDHWINYNLNSRYAIVRSFTVDEQKKVIETIEIGLEDPKEVLLASLGCPLLHKT